MIRFRNTRAENRLIVALDFPSGGEAIQVARDLVPLVPSFKVGLELFTAEGPSIVSRLRELGARVFLDLKFHDIPHTVAGACRAAARLGVWMLNLHVAAGKEALSRAVKAAAGDAGLPAGTGTQSAGIEGATGSPGQNRVPLLVGVTVLTSLNDEAWSRELGLGGSVASQVVTWARLAKKAGLHGVVASAGEVPAVKEACGSDFLTVSPGIRPAWSAAGDQRRVCTPAEAIRLGSDYLVIGRPITAAADPRSAAERVIAEIQVALNGGSEIERA